MLLFRVFECCKNATRRSCFKFVTNCNLSVLTRSTVAHLYQIWGVSSLHYIVVFSFYSFSYSGVCSNRVLSVGDAEPCHPKKGMLIKAEAKKWSQLINSSSIWRMLLINSFISQCEVMVNRKKVPLKTKTWHHKKNK